MEKTVRIEFTAREVDDLIRHLKGLDALYTQINQSGSGPVSALLYKIKLAELIITGMWQSTVTTFSSY